MKTIHHRFTKLFVLVLAIIVFSFQNAFGQKIGKQSIELDIGTNYFFYKKDYYSPNIKPSYSLLYSVYFGKAKVSSGIEYSVKSCDNPYAFIYDSKYQKHIIQYINVPLTFTIPIIKAHKMTIHGKVGYEYDNILNHKVTSYYIDNRNPTTKKVSIDYKLGSSLLFGFSFNHVINSRISINTAPYAKIKTSQESHYSPKTPYDLPLDDYVIGIKVGIEYFIK